MRKLVAVLFVSVALLGWSVLSVVPAPGLVADGGGDLAPQPEGEPLRLVDGGGDLAPTPETEPVLMVDGGGDLAPDFEQPPMILAAGGDHSPDFESTTRHPLV